MYTLKYMYTDIYIETFVSWHIISFGATNLFIPSPIPIAGGIG